MSILVVPQSLLDICKLNNDYQLTRLNLDHKINVIQLLNTDIPVQLT